MDRVDNADAPAGRYSFYGLGVLKVWVHPRLLIDKPGPQVVNGLVRVGSFTSNLPGRHQGWGLNTQPHKRSAVLDEIVGVRHTIFLDIRPGWIFRVWPPVI